MLATGVVAGLVPALRSSRLNLSSSLKEGGRDSASGAGSHRLRNMLIVSQVAASLLLLVCAGLFLRSLQAAQQIDLGFRRDNVLMFRWIRNCRATTGSAGNSFTGSFLIA